MEEATKHDHIQEIINDLLFAIKERNHLRVLAIQDYLDSKNVTITYNSDGELSYTK